jgi:hypothetical protein
MDADIIIEILSTIFPKVGENDSLLMKMLKYGLRFFVILLMLIVLGFIIWMMIANFL